MFICLDSTSLHEESIAEIVVTKTHTQKKYILETFFLLTSLEPPIGTNSEQQL